MKNSSRVRLRIVSALLVLFLPLEAKTSNSEYEKKIREVEARWEAQYGRSHPFAVFENIALIQKVKDQDLKALNCEKSLFGSKYTCDNGVIVGGDKVLSVDSCFPISQDARALWGREGLPDRYLPEFIDFMARTWSRKATVMKYKASGYQICVSGNF